MPGINCPRSTADAKRNADCLIIDKILHFDGGSISRKNFRVNKIFTGWQNKTAGGFGQDTILQKFLFYIVIYMK